MEHPAVINLLPKNSLLKQPHCSYSNIYLSPSFLCSPLIWSCLLHILLDFEAFKVKEKIMEEVVPSLTTSFVHTLPPPGAA